MNSRRTLVQGGVALGFLALAGGGGAYLGSQNRQPNPKATARQLVKQFTNHMGNDGAVYPPGETKPDTYVTAAYAEAWHASGLSRSTPKGSGNVGSYFESKSGQMFVEGRLLTDNISQLKIYGLLGIPVHTRLAQTTYLALERMNMDSAGLPNEPKDDDSLSYRVYLAEALKAAKIPSQDGLVVAMRSWIEDLRTPDGRQIREFVTGSSENQLGRDDLSAVYLRAAGDSRDREHLNQVIATGQTSATGSIRDIDVWIEIAKAYRGHPLLRGKILRWWFSEGSKPQEITSSYLLRVANAATALAG